MENQISREYILLFNAITDTESRLHALSDSLIDIQQKAEELYISADEEKTAFPAVISQPKKAVRTSA